MTEDFLYHVWHFKRYKSTLKTFGGQKIEIESVGQQNTDAGPDFLHAKIRIDDVLWVGNVEIHTKTSDWYFHGHDNDKNYQNLILHVVYTHDLDELPHDCPLLILENNIPQNLIDNYQNLISSKQFIPCSDLFEEVDDFTRSTFVESVFIQRLQNKSEVLQSRLDILNGHWEALLFERIAYVFGLHVNGVPFELLAKSFPFKVLQNIQRKNENLEAFLFGQAGFLQNVKDEYHGSLVKEYQFLSQKYDCHPLDNHLFKLLRLRPSNFPTIRIAQLAHLYQQQHGLFQQLLNAKSIKDITKIFKSVQASEYWQNHYTFGKISKRKSPKKLSDDRIFLLIINAVVPIKFLYGRTQGTLEAESLIEMVRELKPEQNSIIKGFRKIGAKVDNAVDSQGYLELKKTFCEPKKCLHCRIGNKIIQHVR